MKFRKILVTGGAGFIGSFLVDKLVDTGYDVSIYDNLEPQVHPYGVPDYLNKGAEFVHADVRDYEKFKKAILNSEIIFHLAGAVGVAQSQYEINKYVSANIGGTANLLDILVNNKNHVKKVIVAASMSSYGEGKYFCKKCGNVRPRLRTEEEMAKKNWAPRCPKCRGGIKPIPTDEDASLNSNSIYAITKKVQEEMILNIGKTYQIPSVSLRFFNVFGPRQSLSNPYTGVVAIFMSRIKNDHPPVLFEDGLQTRDFISVHDVVDGMISSMEKEEADYQIFNIGSGIPLTIKDVALKIASVYGKEKIEPLITNKFRKGDVRHCYADITKAQKSLGFTLQVSLESGISELIEWSKSAKAVDDFDKVADELVRKKLVKDWR